MCMCVCVCVCVRERERENEKFHLSLCTAPCWRTVLWAAFFHLGGLGVWIVCFSEGVCVCWVNACVCLKYGCVCVCVGNVFL